ncbi:hypothetical protein EYF80_023414 [Liparis tanakae]|uniref:Uncharacterized protein n=1 Tax=Liparis tanakae TaxID=230148 RepID=A0A4Z2HM73_9TELE|nr:hypothetical protein EYF80_023414 [Liparis tanakae]
MGRTRLQRYTCALQALNRDMGMTDTGSGQLSHSIGRSPKRLNLRLTDDTSTEDVDELNQIPDEMRREVSLAEHKEIPAVDATWGDVVDTSARAGSAQREEDVSMSLDRDEFHCESSGGRQQAGGVELVLPSRTGWGGCSPPRTSHVILRTLRSSRKKERSVKEQHSCAKRQISEQL